jgi:hypothetical protein
MLVQFELYEKTVLLNVAVNQGQTGHCGNCREALFFENAMLFFKE